MQDKGGNELNKELVDKAWSEMNKLLDQEMPVQEKKRGIFWWFFPGLLLLGICVIISSEFNPTQSKALSEPIANTEQEPINSTTENKTKVTTDFVKENPINNQNPENQSSSPKRKGNINSIPKKSTKITPETLKTEIATSVNNYENTPSQNILPKDMQTLIDTSQFSGVELSTPSASDSTDLNEITITTVEEKTKQRLLITTVDYLTNRLELLSMDSIELGLSSIGPKVRKQTWSFGADIGVRNTGNFVDYGFHAGIWLRKEKLFGKFFLLSGLRYSRISFDTKWTVMTLSEDQDEMTPVVLGPPTPVMESAALPDPPRLAISSFELPLQLGFRVFPRVDIMAGGWAAYQMFTTKVNEQASTVTISRVNDANIEALGYFVPGEEVPDTYVNPFTYGLSGGINYRWTNRLNINFNYYHRLNPLFENIDLNDALHQYILGVHYEF